MCVGGCGWGGLGGRGGCSYICLSCNYVLVSDWEGWGEGILLALLIDISCLNWLDK